MVIGGLAGILLSLPAAAHAEMKCYRHTVVRANQYALLASNAAGTQVRFCSAEIRCGIGHADIIDSPDGLGTNASAIFIAEPSLGSAAESDSTGRIDTLTQFGLAVESSNVTVIVHWDSVER